MIFGVGFQLHHDLILPHRHKTSTSPIKVYSKRIGKPKLFLRSWEGLAPIFVSDRKSTMELCRPTILRISQTSSNLPQPQQFKHRRLIVPGGSYHPQPAPILHLFECLSSSTSSSTHPKQQGKSSGPPQTHEAGSLSKKPTSLALPPECPQPED